MLKRNTLNVLRARERRQHTNLKVLTWFKFRNFKPNFSSAFLTKQKIKP